VRVDVGPLLGRLERDDDRLDGPRRRASRPPPRASATFLSAKYILPEMYGYVEQEEVAAAVAAGEPVPGEST